MNGPITSKKMADELIISAPSIVWQTRWKLSSNCPSDILKCVQNHPWYSVSSSMRGGETLPLCPYFVGLAGGTRSWSMMRTRSSSLVTVIQLYFKHMPPPQSTYIYIFLIFFFLIFFCQGNALQLSVFSKTKKFLVCLAGRSEFLHHLSLWSPTSRRIFPCVKRLCECSPALGERLALVRIISRSSLFNHCGQDFLWSPRFPLLPALLHAATF